MSTKQHAYAPLNTKSKLPRSSEDENSSIDSEKETLLEQQSEAEPHKRSWISRIRREPVLLTSYVVNAILLVTLLSLISRNIAAKYEDLGIKDFYCMSLMPAPFGLLTRTANEIYSASQ